MAVWRWFQGQQAPSSEVRELYGMLNDMWQEDRKSSKPEQLAAFSQPFDRIEDDPAFKKFLDGLDRAFEN